MFTGIIEEMGLIKNMARRPDSIRLTIQAEKVLEGTILGDSIAVNGVCLTVTELTKTTFSADVMKSIELYEDDGSCECRNTLQAYGGFTI